MIKLLHMQPFNSCVIVFMFVIVCNVGGMGSRLIRDVIYVFDFMGLFFLVVVLVLRPFILVVRN